MKTFDEIKQALAGAGPEAANYASAVGYSVTSAPAVDAVPVVRCRDCKHYGKYTDADGDYVGYCDKIASIMDGYYRGAEDRKPDDYCSQGEREDDHAPD